MNGHQQSQSNIIMNNLTYDNNNDARKQINSSRNGRRVLPIVVDVAAPTEEQGEITTDKGGYLRKPTTTTVTATTASIDGSGYHLDCLDVQAVIAVLVLSFACIGIVTGIVAAIFAIAKHTDFGDGLRGD